jgi:formylglycine-generating enzyme required for sulfatase activity
MRSLSHTWIAALCGFIVVSTAAAQVPDKLPVVEKATHKDYVEKLADRVSFEMIAIPGGTFLMGSPDTEKHRKKDEGPQHPVQIKPFWMGKFEVRWDEYDLFWEKKDPPPKTAQEKLIAMVSRPTPPYTDPTFGYGRQGNAALNITHHAAREFCRWLSAKTGKNYRLPTEAEWEWACRAGTATVYSFGDDPAKLDEHAWIEDNSEEKPQKVGKKKPNPWGLYDMHGNVSEWCYDLYAKDFYSKFPKDKATLGPVNLPINKRYPYVARGGSWLDKAEDCRSAARRFSERDWLRRDPQRPQSIWWMTDADYVGFRVIVPVEEQENLKGLVSKLTRESPD